MAGEEQKVRRSSRAFLARERQALGILLGLFAVVVLVFIPEIRGGFVQGMQLVWQHFFYLLWLGICALLPSSLAFAHRLRSNRRYVGARMDVLRCYLAAARQYASTRGRFETARIFTAGMSKEGIEQSRPGYLMLLGGAVALSIPFLLVATLSAAYMFPTIVEPGLRAAVTGPFAEGLRGLTFAGYGVYVYTLLLIIHRMQAAALSSEFMLGATARALITLVMGFVAGQTEVIQSLGTNNQSGFLYFTLGAFPSWALHALRRRVQAIFQPSIPNQEPLSLEYVDGVTDRIAERLEELGISDIQHLASVDPGELTLRTLYPLARTIDWVDQAILITYLRDRIGAARQMGIRGAIDLSEAYQDARAQVGERAEEPGPTGARFGAAPNLLDTTERARTLLQDLATRSNLPLQALYNIGARLEEDYQVDFLAYLRSRRSRAWPLPALVGAIHHALEDSGLHARGTTGVDGIPEGAFDPKQLESPELQKRFRDRLVAELHRMSLEWNGSFEELRDAATYEELYDMLLARITMRSHEASRPMAQAIPHRSRLPRWLQRAH